jgi:hypothetical protein
LALHPKFKLGLGIGCGALLVAVLLLFGGAVYFAKQMGREYKAVKELEEQLAEVHGPSDQAPEAFTGLPDQARLEVFLSVREGTAEWRRQVEIDFADLLAREGGQQQEGFRQFIRAFKASRDLAPTFSGFWTSRNQALLDGQMGIAEYIYYYCLIYYGWLEHDPADGALDAGAFLSGMGATGPMPADQAEGELEQDQQRRRLWARSQVNSLMLPLLQQAARQAAASTDPGTLLWAGILQEEVRAVQDDPRRVPFAGSLPAQAGAGLEPFRQRLEQTFSVAVNPIELIFEGTWREP